MATKAGMVQAKDIKQGRTFYEVVLTLMENGENLVEVKTLYCGSKLWLHELQSFKKFSSPGIHIGSYKNNPLFSFGFKNFEKANRDGCMNIFMYVFSQSFKGNNTAIRRLFVTRKFAERFAENLRKTFVRTDDQDYHAIHHYRWTREWEAREMNALHA